MTCPTDCQCHCHSTKEEIQPGHLATCAFLDPNHGLHDFWSLGPSEKPWLEMYYDPHTCGPWQISGLTLLRRVQFGGRKGRRAELRLRKRERAIRRFLEPSEMYSPYDRSNVP